MSKGKIPSVKFGRSKPHARKQSPQLVCTINGLMLHKATGEPVKGGDLIDGKTYTVEFLPTLKREVIK